MKLSFERFEIPIIAPCGDLAVAQLKYAHTRHADAFVSNLEMIHAFGHHDITVGYDVTYVPRRSRHSPGADPQGLSNSGAALNRWPRRIPPNSVLAEIAGKLIQVGPHAGLHKLTDQDDALGIFQPEPHRVISMVHYRANRRQLGSDHQGQFSMLVRNRTCNPGSVPVSRSKVTWAVLVRERNSATVEHATRPRIHARLRLRVSTSRQR